MAAGLSAMEAEFREIDESGSWNAIYQVRTSPAVQGGNVPGGEAATLRQSDIVCLIMCGSRAAVLNL